MIKTLSEMKQSFLKCMQIRVLSANLEAEIQKQVAFSLILGNIKRIIMNSGKSNYPLRTVFVESSLYLFESKIDEHNHKHLYILH